MGNKEVQKLRVKGQTFDIKDAHARDLIKIIQELFGNKFDESLQYEYGDYIIKDGVLYRFTDHKSPGIWDPKKVEQSVILNELGKGSGSNGIEVVYKDETEEMIMFASSGLEVGESLEELVFFKSGSGSLSPDETIEGITPETIQEISKRVAKIIEDDMSEITSDQVSDLFDN